MRHVCSPRPRGARSSQSMSHVRNRIRRTDKKPPKTSAREPRGRGRGIRAQKVVFLRPGLVQSFFRTSASARSRDRGSLGRRGAGGQAAEDQEKHPPTTRSNRRSIHAQSDLFIPKGATGCRGSRFPAGLRASSGSEPGSGATQKYIDQAPLGGPLLTDRGLDINKTKDDINKLKVCFILCILT